MAQKIVGVGKVWAGIFCAQNHPSLCQICAGFWCLFSLWWFSSSSLWPFFSHGFRVLKADSISNVFSPGFFGTKVEVFGPWFLCAHFSMDLTSKIIYPLLVGGGSPKIWHFLVLSLSSCHVALEGAGASDGASPAFHGRLVASLDSNGKCGYPWESTLNLYHHVPSTYELWVI